MGGRPGSSVHNDFAKVCHSGARVDAIAGPWGVLPNGSQGSPCGIAEFCSAVHRHIATIVVGLTAGFSKRGYVVGSSLLFERRAAEAQPDRLPQLVDDLKSEAELMITNSYAAARIVKDRSNVPVVAITGADPVAMGLIDSLARPVAISPASAKSQLNSRPSGWRSSRIVSGLAQDCHVVERRRSGNDRALQVCGSGGADTGSRIQPLGVREPEDFAAAFAAMVRDRPDAILMVTDALTGLNRKRVFEFATQHKLPAIYEYDFLVRDGGLMSYGPDMGEVYDRAADLADRILRGARPADLPFEQLTRFRRKRVGCSNGRSAGRAPLRIRSARSAARS